MSKRDEIALPHIDPRVTSPKAAQYQAALAARKVKPPVAGGPSPPMPNLTQDPPIDGPIMTMAEHALRERRQAMAGQVALDGKGGIIQPSVGAAPPPILPNDTLPEEAKKDPAYREGAGAGYAINQLHLAMKYGVMRGGVLIPAAALRPPPSGSRLSDETIKGLAEVAKFQKQRQEAESKSAGAVNSDTEAEKGPAAAAARLANVAGDESTAPLTAEEKKELNSAAARKVDDFDFDTFRQMMMKDLLNNPEQRELIEARLKPLDIADLIIEGTVAQEVQIIPNKFWVTYRSVAGQSDLAVKRLLMEEVKSVQVDDRYYLDKYAFMVLALGLDSINGNPLPTYLGSDGRFSEDMFWRKYNYLTGLNTHMLASLGLNYFWFDVRVRKLFVAEKIKNG